MKKILILFFFLFQLPSYAFDIKKALQYFFKTEQGRVQLLGACVIGVGIFGSRAGTGLLDRRGYHDSVLLLRTFEKRSKHSFKPSNFRLKK